MSRFFSSRFAALTPYTPGEQPQDRRYVKLNTNESPYPPSSGVSLAVTEESGRLQLYSDPESRLLTEALAEHFGLNPDQILVGNGSDELLNFAFMAFCDEEHPAVFPDISYGFYPVFAELNRIPYIEIPLRDDFRIDIEDYISVEGTVIIANPNAPTGLLLQPEEIERLLIADPNRIVVVDEAYIAFGGESCIPLIGRYDNLLAVHTFSKSRSLAGARLGFAVGNSALIQDLNTLKYSTNPYNVNRMTAAAGIAALQENEYYVQNCAAIARTRDQTKESLRLLGFEVTESVSNFLFARHPQIDGEELYLKLKERGVLVRHFSKKRISPYVRITVGTPEQMDILLKETKSILKEKL